MAGYWSILTTAIRGGPRQDEYLGKVQGQGGLCLELGRDGSVWKIGAFTVVKKVS
jgi:hypothetical protein